MRNVCRLSVLFAVAVAITGGGAPAAAVQTIDLREEESGLDCIGGTYEAHEITEGCLIHANGEGAMELRKHVFGIEAHITACTLEFHGRFDNEMSGLLLEQVMEGAGCTREACKMANGEAYMWGKYVPGVDEVNKAYADEGESPEGTTFYRVVLCFQQLNGTGKESCEVEIPFDYLPTQHRIEFGHAGEISSVGASGFDCEIVGHWITEYGDIHDGRDEQEVIVLHM